MRIKYPKAIKEKEEELRRLEQRLRGQKLAERVRMLRLLKSEQEWDLSYKNGKSLWWLFKKQRVKWKTGRRRHKKVNAEQQAAFKKTLAACSSRRRCSGLWPWMKAALA